MPSRSRPALLLLALLLCCLPASAQIVQLSSFNPSNDGGLCSLAYDTVDEVVWVYDCNSAVFSGYATDGTFLESFPRPGESANDVDLEVAPEPLTLAGTTVPAGTVLFINGESGPAEIYGVDPDTGVVLDTLNTAFGVSHVVGGAYSPIRDTFFLVQDRVPGTQDENRIAEIDPVTGAVINTFQIGATFDVNYGDIEVSTVTGNLFVVSSNQSRIAEYTPEGTFVAYHDLPSGVGGLSGIGLDCAAQEAWVSNTNGNVYRLGNVPCGAGCPLSFNTANISPLTIAPGGTFTVSVNVANAGPGARDARLVLDYQRSGGGLSGALALGQGTVPQTSGVNAAVSRRVPGNAPGGSYDLDLHLVDVQSGATCDTRPFTMTVQSPRTTSGGVPFASEPASTLFAPAAQATRTGVVQVAPNPTRGPATLRFTLEASANVRLTVYDALGREVAVLVDGALDAGTHEATFDASGAGLPAGVYVYRLAVGDHGEAGRLTVLR